jgi:LemA protein
MRSKGAIGILLIIILVGLAGCYGCTTNNSLVGAEEEVDRAWADVENQYQRRADLVPQLVESVEAAADLERDLIAAVYRSRDAALSLAASRATSTAEMEAFGRAQEQLAADLGRLTAATKRSTDLQTVEAYRDLLVQLEGTENRIAVARRKYNEAVSDFNRMVRTAPRSFFASLLGFEPKPPFTSSRIDP